MSRKIAFAVHDDEPNKEVFITVFKSLFPATKESSFLYYTLLSVPKDQYFNALIKGFKIVKELQLTGVAESNFYDEIRAAGSVSLFVIHPKNIKQYDSIGRPNKEFFDLICGRDLPFGLGELTNNLTEYLGLPKGQVYTNYSYRNNGVEFIAIGGMKNAAKLQQKSLEYVENHKSEIFKNGDLVSLRSISADGNWGKDLLIKNMASSEEQNR